MVIFVKIIVIATVFAIASSAISNCATTKQRERAHSTRSKHKTERRVEYKTRVLKDNRIVRNATGATYIVYPDGSWNWVPPDRQIDVFPSPTPQPTPLPRPEPTPRRPEAF